MKRAACIAAALAVTASAQGASAHRIDAHVSPSGLEFMEETIPALMPESLELPEMSGSLACGEAAQRDTVVNLEVHDVVLGMPRDGAMRAEIEISVDASGELFLDACGLQTTCQDDFSLSNARAAVEFQMDVVDGAPQMTISEVELLVDEQDVEVQLSGCALDDFANLAIDAARSLFFDQIVNLISDLAANQVAPIINDLLAGLVEFKGHFGPSDMEASILDMHAGTDGLHLAADVGLTSNLVEPASCLAADRPEPPTYESRPPSLIDGAPAHIGAAINLGLIDDVLYNVWRSGLMCLSDAHLAALGIELDLDHHVGKLLPGFPAGTRFSIEVRVMEPPRVEASPSGDATLTFVGRGIEADLIGRHSEGSDTIHVVVDLDATATAAIDRETSSIVLKPQDVEIHRLEVDDEVGGRSLGVDDAHLAHMLETYVAPNLLGKIGEVPVTGSILGFEGNYVLLRDMFTTEGYVAAKVDLFRAPDDDTGRPTVAIESRPQGLVSPERSVIRLTGSDPEIPSELLRYRVVVDGEERPLSFIREVQIGTVGESKTHRVEVSAVDLAGNEDPDPIVLNVDVDGIAPTVEIAGGGIQDASGSKASISWRQHDDLAAEGELLPRVLVYRIRDSSNIMDDELVSELPLDPGTTSYDVPLGPHDLYRVEVRVADEGGNEGVASTIVSANTGGCAVASGGGAAGAGTSLLFALGFFAARRARRRPAESAG